MLLLRSMRCCGMFLHHCDHCGRRELRGPRSLFTDHAGTFVATCRMCGTVSPVLQPRPAAVTAPAAHLRTTSVVEHPEGGLGRLMAHR